MKRDILLQEFNITNKDDRTNYFLKTSPELTGLDMLETYLDASKDRVQTLLDLKRVEDEIKFNKEKVCRIITKEDLEEMKSADDYRSFKRNLNNSKFY